MPLWYTIYYPSEQFQNFNTITLSEQSWRRNVIYKVDAIYSAQPI